MQTSRTRNEWCTDFTYLFLRNGDVRYDCAIIDLYDRSVVASVTDKHITSDLAVRTLQKALDSQHPTKGGLLLHSDQGSQYTSEAFIGSCGSVYVAQSMSKAGYPYDNAPMERYFNTLKNECTKLYESRTDEELYQTVEGFAYVTYNHVPRTAIMATARHTRHERQHKERREHASSLDCLITQDRSWQVLSMAWPRSGAKHH